MQQITIRTTTLKDLDTLLAFEQDLIVWERPFDSTLKDGKIHYYDIPGMINAPHIEIVVAETDGKIIGCGYARIEDSKAFVKNDRHAWLGFMYTHPDFRGRGVNRMIVDHLKQWCTGQSITELVLTVYSPNTSALKAYEKAGFKNHRVVMRMNMKDELLK